MYGAVPRTAPESVRSVLVGRSLSPESAGGATITVLEDGSILGMGSFQQDSGDFGYGRLLDRGVRKQKTRPAFEMQKTSL